MNPKLLDNLLQLFVAAPFVYVISEKQKNPYFSLGLKLIAGSIVTKNLPPILAEVRPLYMAAQEMKAKQEALEAAEKARTVDSTAETVN